MSSSLRGLLDALVEVDVRAREVLLEWRRLLLPGLARPRGTAEDDREVLRRDRREPTTKPSRRYRLSDSAKEAASKTVQSWSSPLIMLFRLSFRLVPIQ